MTDQLNGALFPALMATRHDPSESLEAMRVLLNGRECQQIIDELISSSLNLMAVIVRLEQLTPGLDEALDQVVREYAIDLKEKYGG